MKDTITTTELINLISEVLSQADEKFIQQIANQILTEQVSYIGNDVYEIIN